MSRPSIRRRCRGCSRFGPTRMREANGAVHFNAKTPRAQRFAKSGQAIPMKLAAHFVSALLCVAGAGALAAELAPAEQALKHLLGPNAPDPIPLWTETPPRFAE